VKPTRNVVTVLVLAVAALFIVVVGLLVQIVHLRNPPLPAPPMVSASVNAPGAEPGPVTEKPLPPVPAPITQNAEAKPPAAPEVATGPILETVEEDIVAVAKRWRPGWSFQVDGHRRDWQEISLYAGQEPGKWTRLVQFKWKKGKFVFDHEEAMPKEKERPKGAVGPGGEDRPLTPADLQGVPEEMRPSVEVAKSAALMDHPDWVGKVQSHSADWAKATVWIGPPSSEFASEIRLNWSIGKQCYEVSGKKDLPGE
jgi:hypothetical protein